VFRRILVGFDGSRDASEALRAGITLAAAAHGEVTVLIVVSSGHGETNEDRQRAFETEAASLRAAAEHELRGSISTTTVVQVMAGDRPADSLASYAEERGFDLLVVGRHGRERASHGGLGRMARELAEKARCPVLLVGDQNHDGE
jgi:nucleotide-binding universal stress UspA family protein